jgi:hypothetical protein
MYKLRPIKGSPNQTTTVVMRFVIKNNENNSDSSKRDRFIHFVRYNKAKLQLMNFYYISPFKVDEMCC